MVKQIYLYAKNMNSWLFDFQVDNKYKKFFTSEFNKFKFKWLENVYKFWLVCFRCVHTNMYYYVCTYVSMVRDSLVPEIDFQLFSIVFNCLVTGFSPNNWAESGFWTLNSDARRQLHYEHPKFSRVVFFWTFFSSERRVTLLTGDFWIFF